MKMIVEGSYCIAPQEPIRDATAGIPAAHRRVLRYLTADLYDFLRGTITLNTAKPGWLLGSSINLDTQYRMVHIFRP